MKIRTIYIKSFGKLKDFRLDTNPGLNIIYGSNEAGKTTVMNFIKMMFYGTSAKSSDIGKNPRKKYAPWDGSQMSGYIEFEADGQVYRLEREFGSSNISDDIKLWNLSSGSPEPLSCKYDPGERFMGMNSSAFERSVFIGDISSVIHGTDKEDEITKKLMNYSSSAEENISCETVRKRLQKAHEELRSKNRKNGAIDKLLAEISDKNELLSKAEESEELRKTDEDLHASFCDALEKKKEYCSSISEKIKEQRIIRELHSLEVQNRKNAVKKELEDKIEKLTDTISCNDFTVTESFLDECSEMLTRLRHLKDNYNERKADFNSFSKELSELKLDESIEKAEAELDLINDENQESTEKLDELRLKLSQNIKALDELNNTIRETQIKEELYKEHLADMEPNYLVLIPVALIIVAAIALFLKEPLFLLAAIPVTLVVIFGTKLVEKIEQIRDKRSGIEHKAPDFEEAYRSYDEKMNEYNQISDELNSDIMLLTDSLAQISEKKKEAETRTGHLKLLSDQKNSELSKLNSELNKSGTEISELSYHITDFFSEYRTVSNISEIPSVIDEALDTLTEIEKTKAVLESKLDEDLMQDTPEQINERITVLREKLSQITGEKGPELLSDSETDALEEKYEAVSSEIAALQERIAEIRSSITADAGEYSTPSVIRNEIDASKKELAAMAAYDRSLLIASEVMEEAGNEIRQTFAPELNSKTEKIFSHLTSGKYSNAIISRDLEINSSESENSSLREWQYLSTGTYEQAYFALRLALSDMMTGNKIPVFLDDVFAHYDEERTRKGFLFLNEYSRLNQVIFFTCHRYGIMSDQYTAFPETN